jgi:hydroxypyruvate reductase
MGIRGDLREIMDAALAAAEPGSAVRRFLSVEGGRLTVGEESFEPGRVFVLAVGKAAGAMAGAAAEVLGDGMSGSLCITKTGHEAAPEPFETLYAAHPEPDEGGVEAARRVEELLDGLREGDLLLALVSGGASALLADAAPGVGLADLKALTGSLLRSGAEIGEINAVRKHVSTLKGGNLVRRAAPASVAALLLSDVVGDDPSSIGSGPTAPDPTTLADVWRILNGYDVEPPPSVAEHLSKGVETPKPGDPLFEGVTNTVVGGGRLTAAAAVEGAEKLGYAPMLLSTYLTGDARDVAGLHAAVVREVLASGNPLAPPCAIVTGGEATVVVRGNGTGGPNGEFSLSMALDLEGVEGWAALAVDTDGNDGPTDAAGGLVTGETAARIREGGTDPQAALDDNDAYRALEAGGALIKTGPTGTNVNDLRVVLVGGRGD